MKKLGLIAGIFFLISFVPFYHISAQTSDEQTIKSALTSLMDLSKTKSYESAAKFIAYTGDDKTRNLDTTYNYSDKNELSQVKRFVNKISALLQLSSKYELGNVIPNEENTMYDAEVFFTSGEQRLKTIFKLVKTKSGFLVYEMD